MARARWVRDGLGRLYGVQVVCPGCTAHVQAQAAGHTRYHTLPVSNLPTGETESRAAANAPHWGFNGDMERPTLSPSIRATHPLYDDNEHNIGTYTCHSFVTDGRIQFLGDCTHAMAGQTVDLPGCPPETHA